ncbi:toprim domain-containing protein [Thermoflexus sp.]|uniref:toprim domain-containing protein n=1 Tax=Thermoflexus sp. TaxID=1969742 RepID=UPI00333055DD
MPGKQFLQRRPDGKGGWVWKLDGVPRVLYRLPAVVEAVRRGDTVFLVEGEKDADALASLGLTATTNPQGGGKWRDEYAEVLRGARVVILPDNDNTGKKHAEQVARSLHGKAAEVRVLELPGLPPKGDVSDWLAAGGTREELERLADQAPEWAPPPSEDHHEHEDDEGGRRRKSKSAILVELAMAAELWHDPEGEPWATFTVDGRREHWPTKSKAFRRWLSRRFYETEGGTPGAQAIQDALLVIDGIACYDRPEYPVYTRLAEHNGRIYLDLGDEAWRAVEIGGPGGWRVIPSEQAPVRFRRARGMLALPEPVAGGSLKLLRRYLHVPNDDAWLLIRVWLVGAMHPSGPYPMLVLQGEQGSGKSLAARMLRHLIDPNTAPLRTSPRDEGDLLIAARNGWVVALDNLSGLPDWLSDAICRVATGGGLGKRELYTDTDEVLIDVRRPVILNGIDDLTARDDLRDRSIVLTLPPIPEHERHEERELWAAFESDRPAILGALLDAVAAAMRYLPETHLPRLPRMADFARWAAAAGRAAGWTPEEFMTAYSGNRDEAAAVGVEASPVGQAIRALAEEKKSWEGTATELLAALRERAGENDRTLPRDPRTLSNHVRRLAPALRAVGVDVEMSRVGKQRTRLISLTLKGEQRGETSSASSAASASPPLRALTADEAANGRSASAGSGWRTMSPPGGRRADDKPGADKPRHDGIADEADAADAKSRTQSNREVGRCPIASGDI